MEQNTQNKIWKNNYIIRYFCGTTPFWRMTDLTQNRVAQILEASAGKKSSSKKNRGDRSFESNPIQSNPIGLLMGRNFCDVRLLLVAAVAAFIFIQVTIFTCPFFFFVVYFFIVCLRFSLRLIHFEFKINTIICLITSLYYERDTCVIWAGEKEEEPNWFN